jgi:hypothetical protein
MRRKDHYMDIVIQQNTRGTYARNENLETRIEACYGVPASAFLLQCQEKGITINETAKMLCCSVSNVKRIRQKFGLSFMSPGKRGIESASDHPEFYSQNMNCHNALCRAWV